MAERVGHEGAAGVATLPDIRPARLDLGSNLKWFAYYRFFLNFQLWFPIWVLYLQDFRGFSLTQVTALDAAFWMAIVLGEAPTGTVADRWGRRQSLVLGAICFVIAVLIFGLATSYPLVLLSYVIWGLSLTLQSGADEALLWETMQHEGRAEQYVRVSGRMTALNYGAVMGGELLGAPLAALTTLQVPVLASTLLALPAIYAAWRLREPPRTRPPEHTTRYWTLMRGGFGRAWRTPVLRATVALSSVLTAGTMGLFIFQQPLLAERGVPVALFPLVLVPASLCRVAGSLLVDRFRRRLGDALLFGMMIGVIAVGYLVLAAIKSPLVVVAFLPAFFAAAFYRPQVAMIVNTRAPDTVRATMLSIISLSGSLLLALAEPGLGILADRQSLDTAFVVAGVTLAIAGAICLWWWMWTVQAEAAR